MLSPLTIAMDPAPVPAAMTEIVCGPGVSTVDVDMLQFAIMLEVMPVVFAAYTRRRPPPATGAPSITIETSTREKPAAAPVAPV